MHVVVGGKLTGCAPIPIEVGTTRLENTRHMHQAVAVMKNIAVVYNGVSPSSQSTHDCLGVEYGFTHVHVA